MILQDIALLASDTARTKAYVQRMVKEQKAPSVCVVYADDIGRMKKEAEAYDGQGKRETAFFDREEPLLFTLQKAGLRYLTVENRDINSEEMKECIVGLPQNYLIYSGYGGYILKPHLFSLGKKYIHVHAGILPQYRGSTTAYYSFLQEGGIGAAAIFLSPGIDEGEIIAQSMFGLPDRETDMDYIYEPYIRSCVLMDAVERYLKNGRLDSVPQNSAGAETYFIIHPVLKHLALEGMGKGRKG